MVVTEKTYLKRRLSSGVFLDGTVQGEGCEGSGEGCVEDFLVDVVVYEDEECGMGGVDGIWGRDECLWEGINLGGCVESVFQDVKNVECFGVKTGEDDGDERVERSLGKESCRYFGRGGGKDCVCVECLYRREVRRCVEEIECRKKSIRKKTEFLVLLGGGPGEYFFSFLVGL
jgi:hypothetical protein